MRVKELRPVNTLVGLLLFLSMLMDMLRSLCCQAAKSDGHSSTANRVAA
jgi:hypothetical protein